MKLSLTVVVLFLSLFIVPVASGQKVTCSCEKAPDNTCHGNIICTGGCTSVCGVKDECYLSCRSDLVYVRITIKFVKSTGEEIATMLSDRSHKRIQFTPYP